MAYDTSLEEPMINDRVSGKSTLKISGWHLALVVLGLIILEFYLYDFLILDEATLSQVLGNQFSKNEVSEVFNLIDRSIWVRLGLTITAKFFLILVFAAFITTGLIFLYPGIKIADVFKGLLFASLLVVVYDICETLILFNKLDEFHAFQDLRDYQILSAGKFFANRGYSTWIVMTARQVDVSYALLLIGQAVYFYNFFQQDKVAKTESVLAISLILIVTYWTLFGLATFIYT